MSLLKYNELNIGDEIPTLIKKPINRTTLALFAGASNDHNPIHIDIDFAKKSGFEDVFAHGMLVMAYLGQVLTNWVPQTAIREFSSRFKAITNLGDVLSCKGIIEEKMLYNGENCVKLALSVVNQDGEEKLAGSAIIAF
jgi:acyl dehydratase